MAEVGSAARAARFHPSHTVALVGVFLDVGALQRLVKTRPARTRLELRSGTEQRRATADTVVHACILGLPVLSREGPLGPRLACHMVLLRSQLSAPFGLGLDHFIFGFCHRKNLSSL